MVKEYDGTPYTLRVTVKCEECEKDMFAEASNVGDGYINSTVSFMRSDLLKRLKKGHDKGNHVTTNK